jgi:hypothetical protein
MSRQWVKLHTCILNDPKILRLPPAVRWHFVALVVAAGTVDKDGLIGEPEDVAVRIRVSDEELATIVAQLGKKVRTDKKGQLWIADWKDWQSPRDNTNAARQAKHRNARRNGVTNGVTNGDVTALELELDIEPEEEQKQPPPPPPALQTAARRAGTPPKARRERDVLFDAFCNVHGFDPDNPGKKAGLARQFSARCERLERIPTPADVQRFVEREKQRLVGDVPAWGTVTKPHSFADAFVGWWQAGSPGSPRRQNFRPSSPREVDDFDSAWSDMQDFADEMADRMAARASGAAP